MMPQANGRKFWNRIAARYAARPIKDVAAYEALLAEVSSRLARKDRVLEIGCGTGGTAIRLAPGVARYIATDFSEAMIRIAKAKPAPPNLDFAVAEVENTFGASPFDAICAFNVLHLVDDLPGLLASLHTHLRPGGLLISKTWCFADVGWKLRLLFAGLRLFGLFPPTAALEVSGLRQTMEDAGFEIIDERIFGAYAQNPYIVAQKPEAAPNP